MNLIAHNADGATIRLDQRELLLVMALVQEGREVLECNTESGKALDQFFRAANVLVEQTRRTNLDRPLRRQKMSLVANPHTGQQRGVSNG